MQGSTVELEFGLFIWILHMHETHQHQGPHGLLMLRHNCVILVKSNNSNENWGKTPSISNTVKTPVSTPQIVQWHLLKASSVRGCVYAAKCWNIPVCNFKLCVCVNRKWWPGREELPFSQELDGWFFSLSSQIKYLSSVWVYKLCERLIVHLWCFNSPVADYLIIKGISFISSSGVLKLFSHCFLLWTLAWQEKVKSPEDVGFLVSCK